MNWKEHIISKIIVFVGLVAIFVEIIVGWVS